MAIWKLLLAGAAGGLAGIVNAMAGGGTLITYPSLLLLGHGPIVANTTSTLALWPGYVAASFGFRPNLAGTRRMALYLSPPSLAGGLAGAVLLLTTPAHVFDAVVPALVLGATLLLAWQGRNVERPPGPPLTGARLAGTIAFQFAAGVYGGYFGGALGFLLLAGFSFFGMRDMLQMSGLKNLLTVLINGAALVFFLVRGRVSWADGLAMAAGAVAGGYAGARLARRIGGAAARRAVIVLGFIVSAGLLIRALL
jgi:uncharacterized membrane protein YfcA